MNEQEFQLELERFKQKASWETRLFYFILSALWGIILLYFNGIRVLNLEIIYWFLILGLFLLVGEWLIQGGWHMIGYLNVQKEILRKKILGQNAKMFDDNKIRDLIVLEKRKSNLENKILKKKAKTERLEQKILKISSQIEELKKAIWKVK